MSLFMIDRHSVLTLQCDKKFSFKIAQYSHPSITINVIQSLLTFHNFKLILPNKVLKEDNSVYHLLMKYLYVRHYKLEAEIAMMTWRVSWSDVLQPGGRLRGSMHSLARRYSSGVSIVTILNTDIHCY